MTKEISKLKNNIEYIYKQNKNTPRMALCLNFSINEPEEKTGDLFTCIKTFASRYQKIQQRKNLQMNLKNMQ